MHGQQIARRGGGRLARGLQVRRRDRFGVGLLSRIRFRELHRLRLDKVIEQQACLPTDDPVGDNALVTLECRYRHGQSLVVEVGIIGRGTGIVARRLQQLPDQRYLETPVSRT